MRKVRFTEEQMVAIMREADREPAAVVAKRHCATRAASGEGRGRDRADAGAVGAISALWLSPHPYLSRPRWASHERRPVLPACRRRARGHASAWRQHGHARKRRRDRTRCDRMTLCIRPSRQRAAAQVPHRDGRVHQGGADHRRRRSHEISMPEGAVDD
jgi:hypothetical protein